MKILMKQWYTMTNFSIKIIISLWWEIHLCSPLPAKKELKKKEYKVTV